MPELLLGLDVGSTSVRALLVDPAGTVLAMAHRRVESMQYEGGRVEQDASRVWALVQEVQSEALEQAGHQPREVAAIGLTTQRTSVVVWERATGRPLAPMIMWSDLRGVQRAQELEAAAHISVPQSASSKLEAAIALVPEGRIRMAKGELCWGTIDSYIVFQLSGGAAHLTDPSNAWMTCYLDFGTARDWNGALIEHQQLELGMFPRVSDSYGMLATTRKQTFGAEVPIAAVIADQQCAMLAHGCWSAGQWKATYGTSAALMVCTGEALALWAGLTPLAQLGVGGQTLYALEGMVLSAGSLFEWLESRMGILPSVGELSVLASTVSDNGGVAIRPALHGLGTPHNLPNQSAALLGLSAASARGHVALAAMEAVAYRIREIVDCAVGGAALDVSAGLSLPEVLPVDGGPTGNDAFMQIQANALGRPVRRHAVREATALGACIGAALGAGVLARDQLEPFTRYGRTFEPQLSQDEADSRLLIWQRAIGVAAGRV